MTAAAFGIILPIGLIVSTSHPAASPSAVSSPSVLGSDEVPEAAVVSSVCDPNTLFGPPRTLDAVPSADVGEYSSVALGSNGFARVAYLDSTNRELKFVRCLDFGCGSRNITKIEVGGKGTGWGFYVSLALGSDGMPRISSYDAKEFGFEYVVCDDVDCTSARARTIDIGSNNSHTGPASSLTLDSADNAVMSYRWQDSRSGRSKQRYVRCADRECETFTASPANLGTVSNDAVIFFEWSDIAVGGDDNARIVWFDEDKGQLRYTRCVNPGCGKKESSGLDSGNAGQFNSITLGPDGLPRIAYYALATDSLNYVRCHDDDCANFTLRVLDDPINGGTGRYPSIGVGSDGFARISYYDQTNGDLEYIECHDIDCDRISRQTLDGATADVGQYSALAVGPGDAIHITYHDATNGTLKYVNAQGALIQCQILGQAGTTYSLSSDVTAAGEVCFSVLADDVTLDCLGHTITLAEHPSLPGLYGTGLFADGAANATIKNCVIEGKMNAALSFSRVDGATITGNTFGGTTMTVGAAATWIATSSNVTFTNNAVSTVTHGSPIPGAGLLLKGVTNSVIDNNLFSNAGEGLSIDLGSTNNEFSGNWFEGNEVDLVIESLDNRFSGTNVSGPIRIEQAPFGSITYPYGADLTTLVRLRDVIWVGENSISVDSSAYPGLDRAASLELNGLSDWAYRVPAVDEADDGSLRLCSAAHCTGASSSPTRVSYNVPGFTTYSSVVTCPTEVASADPGQESVVTGFDRQTGDVTINYQPACNATQHTIYVGPLPVVGGLEYTDRHCAVGTGGTATFNPGAGNYFWLVVGQNSGFEGSYGRDSSGYERPEDLTPSECSRPFAPTACLCP